MNLLRSWSIWWPFVWVGLFWVHGRLIDFGVLGLFDLYVVLMLVNLPFLIRYVARTHFPNTIDSNKRRSLADWFVIGLQAVSIEVLTVGLSVIAMLWFSRNYLAAQSTGNCQSDRQSSKW